jgi:hypothetical protein
MASYCGGVGEICIDNGSLAGKLSSKPWSSASSTSFSERGAIFRTGAGELMFLGLVFGLGLVALCRNGAGCVLIKFMASPYSIFGEPFIS